MFFSEVPLELIKCYESCMPRAAKCHTNLNVFQTISLKWITVQGYVSLTYSLGEGTRYGSPKELLVVLWGSKCSHAAQTKEIMISQMKLRTFVSYCL